MKLQLTLFFLLLQSCQSAPTFTDIATPNSLEKRIEYFLYFLNRGQAIKIYFKNHFEECRISVQKNNNGYTWFFYDLQSFQHPITTTTLKETEELHYSRGSNRSSDAKKIIRQVPITETTIQTNYTTIPILKFEVIDNNLYFSTNKDNGAIYESINRNKDFFIALSNNFITQKFWINTTNASFFTWNKKTLTLEPSSIKINLENNNTMLITIR